MTPAEPLLRPPPEASLDKRDWIAGLEKGLAVIEAFDDGATMHAIWLTLKVAAITVPLNTLFGLAAAWCVSRFQFRGKRFLTSLIELPLWVSPVIAGMVYVLLFGAQGLFGPALKEHGIKIIFALPGIVLSTIFVTFTFVARILAPQMEAQGQAEEEPAVKIGPQGHEGQPPQRRRGERVGVQRREHQPCPPLGHVGQLDDGARVGDLRPVGRRRRIDRREQEAVEAVAHDAPRCTRAWPNDSTQ